MTDEKTIETLAAEQVAKTMAQWEAERAAARAAEQKQVEAERAAWHAAIAPTIVACGVRPSLIGSVVEQAHDLFELREGKVVAKPGFTNWRDPCADYTVVDWLADLHTTDDNLLWEKQK